ncbi:MAG: DUF1345 domain-containing protein [Proteobacteria bacterium]|nr:DUF1345 domain-containing protein [Pseudomonadota bacterium]MDE3208335.1 DUF1345 domain-containing protein [Pseudomonadota bacterium]
MALEPALEHPLLTINRRLGVGVIIALAAYPVLPGFLPRVIRLFSAWDLGCLSFLALTFYVLSRYHSSAMRQIFKDNDASLMAIRLLVVIAACMSLLAIALLLKHTHQLPQLMQTIGIMLGLLAILLSWMLVHTMFATHYAHRYYGDGPRTKDQQQTKGLAFPGGKEPNFLDFLYFSFVIGMTAQVSDVQITSTSMRRLVLIHGMLSFFFYAFILALTINMVASLM